MRWNFFLDLPDEPCIPHHSTRTVHVHHMKTTWSILLYKYQHILVKRLYLAFRNSSFSIMEDRIATLYPQMRHWWKKVIMGTWVTLFLNRTIYFILSNLIIIWEHGQKEHQLNRLATFVWRGTTAGKYSKPDLLYNLNKLQTTGMVPGPDSVETNEP
jgi:hypothetical protein